MNPSWPPLTPKPIVFLLLLLQLLLHPHLLIHLLFHICPLIHICFLHCLWLFYLLLHHPLLLIITFLHVFDLTGLWMASCWSCCVDPGGPEGSPGGSWTSDSLGWEWSNGDDKPCVEDHGEPSRVWSTTTLRFRREQCVNNVYDIYLTTHGTWESLNQLSWIHMGYIKGLAQKTTVLILFVLGLRRTALKHSTHKEISVDCFLVWKWRLEVWVARV